MMIGDGIVLGAGGESASIFVIGLNQTDTVTASTDGKTVVGKWVTKTVRKYDVDLIPNMTSDTEPRGVASASMVSGESYAYKAFDGDSETIAYGGYPSIPWSVQYEFETEVTIKKVNYIISNHNYYAGNTIAYQIQISQDGTNWETIHTGSTSNGGQSPYSTEFTLTEPKNAKYIRLYQTSNTGTGYSGALYTLQANGDMDVQTGGFEIAPIKCYGKWVVSNADNTKTAEVLVDSAAEFEVTL